MTRYVFDNPEAMFHWIDETVKKLLTIPRAQFGKIQIDISRTELGANYGWLIRPEDKQAWKKRFEDEKK
jgi:hypothetical protein